MSSTESIKIKVAIVGGGPAGLFLSQILHLHDIDSFILNPQRRRGQCEPVHKQKKC